jgi:opacity protein-like surface antigen
LRGSLWFAGFQSAVMRNLSFCILVALLVLAIPAAARAQESQEKPAKLEVTPLRIGSELFMPEGKFRIGPFRLHGFVSERYGQDSNVFLLEDDPESSSLLVSEGGLRLDLAHSRQLFLLGYRARANSYSEKDAHDSTEHEAMLKGHFRLNSFFIKLDDEYVKLYEPTPLYFATKAGREEHRGTASIGIDGRKLYIEAGYGIRNYNYTGKDYDRANNNQGIMLGVLGYRLSPKTKVMVRYDSGYVDYTLDKISDSQNDYTYTSLYLGIDYRLTDKLLSYLFVGSTSQSVDVKNDTTQTKEFSGATALGSLAFKATEKVMINATVLRELQYNAYVNYLVVSQVEMSVRYRWTRKMMVSVRAEFETAQPSEKIKTMYPSSQVSAGISARYDLTKWVAVGLDFEFTDKSSSRDLQSYSGTKVFLFLTAYF